MWFSVSPELYREAAVRLCDGIGCSDYFSGAIAFTYSNVDCRLTASLIVYRRTERAPEGVSHPIADLVPVWWEFHTVGPDGELLNDFSFAELKSYAVCV